MEVVTQIAKIRLYEGNEIYESNLASPKGERKQIKTGNSLPKAAFFEKFTHLMMMVIKTKEMTRQDTIEKLILIERHETNIKDHKCCQIKIGLH